MFIGKISKIFDYDKWLVNVNNKEESREVPIGDFVRIGNRFVGVVIGNHQDIPEDYLANELNGDVNESVFIDELEEEKVYYSVLGLGEFSSPSFGISTAPSLKQEVYDMSKEEIIEFHNKNNEVSFEYYSDLIDFEKTDPEVILKILERLEEVFSDKEDELGLINALKKHTRRIGN